MKKPEWVDEWLGNEESIPEEGYDWIRSRPECIKEQMKLFPPSAVVRFLKDGCCDVHPGGYGIITVYYEHSNRIGVRLNPSANIVHKVPVDILQIVGYWKCLNSERIKQIC